MAEKRMFSLSVIDSDDFTSMPATTQLLYFHLAMRADDDGFVNKPRQIMSFVGAKDDDMKVLISKQYVIPFDNGIIVIRHWRLHNCIQRDRYKPTAYQNEYRQLVEDGHVYKLETDCIQIGNGTETQNRLDKNRLDKIRIEEDRIDDDMTPTGDPLIMFAADNLIGMNADLAEELVSYRGQMTDDMIRWAINHALSHGSRNFAYVRTVLNGIVERGFKTLAEVKAAEEERNKRQQETPATPAVYGKPKKPMDARSVTDNDFDKGYYADIMNRPRSNRVSE